MECTEEIGSENDQGVGLSVCKTKPRRVKVPKKVKQKNRHHLKYYNRPSRSTSSNEQDFPSISWHVIFVFLVPILIGVLQVEYQNKNESPFETHPLQKHIFLTAICVYGALLGIKIHTKTSNGYLQKILNYGLLLSGGLSSVSLLSMLLKKQLLWTLLIIWGSVPIILARTTLISSACWIIEMLAKFTRFYFKVFSASGSNDVCPRV